MQISNKNIFTTQINKLSVIYFLFHFSELEILSDSTGDDPGGRGHPGQRATGTWRRGELDSNNFNHILLFLRIKI